MMGFHNKYWLFVCPTTLYQSQYCMELRCISELSSHNMWDRRSFRK